MKNKIELKKYLNIMLITCILLTLIFTVINNIEYITYKKNFNNKIVEILSTIKKNYPQIETTELIETINSEYNDEFIKQLLNKYGIDINTDDIILKNNKDNKTFKIINITYLSLSFIIIIMIFLIYIYNKNKKLKDITKLLEKINNRDYTLDIDSNTEDELSILKNELYKTTIMLKEQAENENKDKINLKNSLEDISHQLKTPLTSIMIYLDNLNLNPDMEKETRVKFINNINREINNINFLIQSILKLSKFDANTIEFFRKKVKVSEIINESIKNISLLSDLKNIKITINGDNVSNIYCDKLWQIEAITNILKNAIEHSPNNSEIKINYEENKISTKISINSNSIIDKEDLPNIFKRFYKGKNASTNSVGIGLALSESIIKNESGKINVTSNKKDGTTFIVKYYK